MRLASLAPTAPAAAGSPAALSPAAPPRARARRPRLALAVLLVATGACYRWEPSPVRPAPTAPPALGYVEAVRLDGSTVRLARARAGGDSLLGRRPGLVTSRRVAIPLDSVAALRRRRFDRRRSAIVGMTLAVLAPIAFAAAAPFTPR